MTTAMLPPPETDDEPLDLDALIAALSPEDRAKRARPHAAGALAGIWAWFMGLPLLAQIFVGALVGAGLYYAARLLSRPKFSVDVARAYGFRPRRNTSGIGLAVPVLYGEHRVWPAVVNEYIDVVGDLQTLFRLAVVSEGEIESITLPEINDQDSAKFTGATVTTRLGTAGQTAIPGFENTRNTYDVSIDLLDVARSFIYTTFTSIDQFIARMAFAGGLSDAGGANPTTVTMRVEYRLVGVVPFTLLGDFVYSSTSGKPVTKQQASGTLTRGRYDIRVTLQARTGPPRPTTFHTVDEIIVQATPNTYPNVALAALSVQASEQLSGEVRFSVLAKGRKVRTLSGGVLSTTEAWSQNNVECLIDAMTNKRYGRGADIADADIDLVSFQAARTYCNTIVQGETRHRMDLVCDEQKSWVEWLEHMVNTFRGIPVESDGRYRLAVDDIAPVSQRFTDGNIIRGSFKTSWVSLADEYDSVELFYLDQALYYTRTSVRLPLDPVTGVFLGTKTKQVDGRGVTRRTHATREAQYHLNALTILSRFVEFSCGLDALAVDVGDVIDVQSSIPKWGQGGRVVAAVLTGGNHVVTVDRNDLPTAGLGSHVLGIRQATDVIEERSLVSVGAPFTTAEGYPRQDVTVSGIFSTLPAARDALWVLGVV